MEISRVPVVIIAPDNLFRDSLKVVMEASGKFLFDGETDDCATGLKMIRELSPQLVVVSTDILDDKLSWEIIQKIHLEQPNVSFCIVVNTREEEYLARRVRARIVLRAGFSTKSFFDEIAKLTNAPANDQPISDPFGLYRVVDLIAAETDQKRDQPTFDSDIGSNNKEVRD